MSGAMAFLAGMGTGYINGKNSKREQDRQDAKDKRDQTLFDRQMEELNRTRDDRQAVRDVGQAQQSDTYTPAQGQEIDAIANAKDAQGNPYYAVGNDATGKYTVAPNFQDETGTQPKTYTPATIAASGVNYLGKSYDKPLSDAEATGAKRTRMADLAAGGNAFAANALDNDHKTVKFDQEQQANLKKLKDEGVFDAAAALRRGDAAGMSEAFNRSGEHKIIGDVTITPEKRTIPNVGEVDTFTATFQMEGPDGKVQQVTRNSLDLSTQLMPYEKQLAQMQDAATKAETVRHNKATEGVAQQNANTNEQYRKDQAAYLRETTSRLTANAKAADAPPTWSKDADEHIVKLNTSKNPETGREELDGNGAQFMQAVALDIARKNGGNTMAAISRAAEVDAALKSKSKGDMALLAQLRNEAYSAASGRPNAQQVAQQSAPAPAPAPAQQQPAANAASMARVGATAPIAQPAQAPAPARPMSAIDQIQAKNMAALAPLAQQVKQANQMFVAAAKSGDQKAMAQYMQTKEALRVQLEQQVNEKFGNGAAAVLQKLYTN